jgi:hypothetical protein
VLTIEGRTPMKLAGMLRLGFVSLALSCSSTTTGDARGQGSTARGDYLAFTKNVPGEGTFVMYALLASNKVSALAYTQKDGKAVVDSKDGPLEESERATIDQLFTGELRTAYGADNWTGQGSTTPTNCPESEKICTPGQTTPTCICMPPPGSTTVLQYDVVYNRLTDYGSYKLREPMGQATTDMVNALEAMRVHHYGK